MKNKKTTKLKGILGTATIVAGLGLGAYKAADIYIDGALPDLKSNAEWIETDFNINADLGAFLYHSHKKEGGKYMYENPSRNNYSAFVKEYNQEKDNDPKKTGKIYLPDTNSNGEVGPGDNW